MSYSDLSARIACRGEGYLAVRLFEAEASGLLVDRRLAGAAEKSVASALASDSDGQDPTPKGGAL